VVLQLSSKLHEHFFLTDACGEFLEDLLYPVIKPVLRSDLIKTRNQLLHHLARVLLIFFAQHANKVHDPFHKLTFFKV
jgi:hypothetical protein